VHGLIVPHRQLPLVQRSEWKSHAVQSVPPSVGQHWHEPEAHWKPASARQEAQGPPPIPHALLVGVVQTLLLQQPAGQETASQPQTPLTQCW